MEIVWPVLLIILLVLANFVAERSRERLSRNLRKRAAIAFDEWYDRYYGDPIRYPKEHVAKILGQFATEWKIQPTHLRPDDRFVDLTGLPKKGKFIDDDCWGEIELIVEDFLIDTSWDTLDDLIRGTSAQLKAMHCDQDANRS